jgi:hypothetical protein
VDEQELGERIRGAIAAGKLPYGRPNHTWGGRGTGARCSLCDTPVLPQEKELELEFITNVNSGSLGRHFVHVHCWSLWELEREKAVRASASPVEEPPAPGPL